VFNPLHARRIVATTEFNNESSMSVMRALGMELLRDEMGKPFWCEIVGVLNNPFWNGLYIDQ